MHSSARSPTSSTWSRRWRRRFEKSVVVLTASRDCRRQMKSQSRAVKKIERSALPVVQSGQAITSDAFGGRRTLSVERLDGRSCTILSSRSGNLLPANGIGRWMDRRRIAGWSRTEGERPTPVATLHLIQATVGCLKETVDALSVLRVDRDACTR